MHTFVPIVGGNLPFPGWWYCCVEHCTL